MDASSTYHFTTFLWLLTQATPLLVAPQMLLNLLATELPTQDGPAIDLALATYLARSVAITSLALAVLSLLLSGLIPLSTLADVDPAQASAMYSTPTTMVTTLFHTASAFHAYTSYQALAITGGGTAYLLGAICSGSLAAIGVWVVMFGGGSRFSKRTGKDKRSSGFLFGDRKGKRGIMTKET